MSISIQKAGVQEIPLIRSITYRVWPQTYASILSAQQLEYMLELMYSEESLEKQMNGEKHQYIISYEDGEPVGFASFSETAPGIWKLHKLYVLPSQQRKGTGKKLLNYVSKEAAAMGAKALQLQVNRYNSARSFYEKLGFVVIDEKDFDIGNGYFMNDFVMEREVAE